MQKIHKLSPQLADMIAAGEVVERPGSVVKELVENSIDAGATSVTIEIQNGGMSYIRVSDNGSGMSEEDAGLAFLRHATSKLREERDLEAIHTLGFRGEALAAISAVSRIELLTREENSTEGIAMTVEAGNITETSPAGCPQGTTIIVRDLFFNTPARLKFMKKDSAEAANVSSVVHRIALSHPEVALRYIRDGKEEAVTPGNGDITSCIYSLLGREFSKGLLHIVSGDETVSVNGYITSPDAGRGNRSAQYMYVNGRYVKSQLLQAALERGYKNSMASGRYPGCVLYLKLKTASVDVNVHPAKTEVRFLNERAVFNCVYYAVKSALEARGLPERYILSEEKPVEAKSSEYGTITAEEYLKGRVLKTPVAEYGSAAAPAAESGRLRETRGADAEQGDTKTCDTGTLKEPARSPAVEAETCEKEFESPAAEYVQERLVISGSEDAADIAPDFRIVGEAFSGYIIVQVEDRLILMDKHAAHERLIFDSLKSDQKEQMSQFLLTPVTVDVGKEDAALLLDSADIFEPLGFEIDDFGSGTVLIRRLPADIDQEDVPALLGELCKNLSQGERPGSLGIRDEILSTMACKAAVKIGKSSDPLERRSIVEKVMTGRIKYCPHGRPVTMDITKLQLEKGFKRK